ncbi:MAG: hypothetical protein QNJ98_10310 [Planctomycetota bacterium]|nr:hypothetical protein [Planctomycetota bacterium]
MRRTLLTIALLIATCCLAPAAAAEPPYSAEDLRPNDARLENGWTLSDDEPEDLEARIEAVAEKAEYDTFNLEIEVFRIEKAESPALDVALLDVDEDPATMRKALDAEAAKQGWTVRELASPHRLLLVTGGSKAKSKRTKEHEDASGAMVLYVAHKLGDIAAELSKPMPDSGVARKRQLRNLEALGKAVSALGIEGGLVHALALVPAYVRYNRIRHPLEETKQRLMAWWGNEKNRAHYQKEYDELKAESEPLEKALWKHARQAMAKDVANAPRGTLRFMACASAALGYLEEETKQGAVEASRLLEDAVANIASAPGAGWAVSARYNLACAYALAGKEEKVLSTMKSVFEAAEAESQDYFGHFYVQALDEEELAAFRASEGGKKLMKSVQEKVGELVAKYLKRMAELKSQGFDLDD